MNKKSIGMTESGRQISSQSKFWQIWLPLIIGIIVIFLFGFSFILRDKDNNFAWQVWVNISIILLLLPLFLVGISLIIAIIIVLYLLNQANKNIYQWLRKIQPIIFNTITIITKIANVIVKPFLLIESIKGGVVSLLKKSQ